MATPDVPSVTPNAIFDPAEPGGEVRPGSGTPKSVARAIESPRVVVVAFLLFGAADDGSVRSAVRELRRSPTGQRGVAYFVYDVGGKARFGDLPEVLGVTETPTVVVIGRDRRLTNRWVGLVDAAILRQSVADAKSAPPAGARPATPSAPSD